MVGRKNHHRVRTWHLATPSYATSEGILAVIKVAGTGCSATHALAKGKAKPEL